MPSLLQKVVAKGKRLLQEPPRPFDLSPWLNEDHSGRPAVLLLNDTRDQNNHGSQALADALVTILAQHLPAHQLRIIPSAWLVDIAEAGRVSFVDLDKDPTPPAALWPNLADEFEPVAEEWLAGRGGAGAQIYLQMIRGAALVVLNGEGSVYRTNLSAIRELYLAWLAKTRLHVPTVFLNGTVHLTHIMPILPAMVRKTFRELDEVLVREPWSQRNVAAYVPPLQPAVAPDSAWHLSPEEAVPFAQVANLPEALRHEPFFCFDVGPMGADCRWPGRSAAYLLLEGFKAMGLQCVVVAKQLPSDAYLQDLATRTDSYFFGPERNYRELMGLQSAAQFQLTGRYHNLILGTLVGCPTIPFCQASHKVHGVCELLEGLIGMPYDSTDLRTSIPEILARAQVYLDEQTTLRPRLRAQAAKLAEGTQEMGRAAARAWRVPAPSSAVPL